MRRLVLTATVAAAAVGGVLTAGIGLEAATATAPRDEPPATTCGSHPTTVSAADITDGSKVIQGNSGDDWVVIPGGYSFAANGGTDRICSPTGVVEGISYPTDDPTQEKNQDLTP